MNRSRPLSPVDVEGLVPARAELDVEALFRCYAPYVARIAHQLLGRDDEVDDVIQDVFVAAVRGVHQIRDPAAVKGWLASITVRMSRRRLRFRRFRSLFGAEAPHAYSHVVQIEASPDQRVLMSRVYQVLDTLPTETRIAWVLRHIQGEKLERVAGLCSCSLATAKRRIAQAHGALQEALGDG